MIALNTLKTFCLAAALTVAGGIAHAATLTVTGDAKSVDAAQSTVLEGFTLSSNIKTVKGSKTNAYRDVFEGAGKGTPFFFALNKNTGTGTLDVDGVAKSFSFLWGSPDTYNSLAFLLDGVEQAHFTGADLGDTAAASSRGAKLVEIDDLLFDTVTFKTNDNAFEFANVTVAPVPLPAAGLLLVGALGGMAMVRRRKAA